MNGGLETSRRKFVQVGTVSLLGLGSVDAGQLQLEGGSGPLDEYEFQGAADLLGPASARPAPGSDFFDNKKFYAYRYTAADTGAVAEITQGDDSWREIPTHLKEYATNDLPPSPPNGSIHFDTDRGLPAWFDRDHYEWPAFVDNGDVETSDDQVANTTTETEIFRYGTNPGALVAGRVLIVRNFGVYETAASEDRFTYRVYIGGDGFDPVAGEGTEIASLPTVQENINTPSPWHAKTTVIIESEGTSGEVDTHTEGRFNDTPNDDHNRDVTLDTSTAGEVVGTIQWNNAKTDNIARQDMGYLQQMA